MAKISKGTMRDDASPRAGIATDTVRSSSDPMAGKSMRQEIEPRGLLREKPRCCTRVNLVGMLI